MRSLLLALLMLAVATPALASGLVVRRSHGPRGSDHGQMMSGRVDRVPNIPQPWNVLFLYVDDSSSLTWGASGNASVPAIDSLRTNGITFDNVYGAAVCGAGRSIFLSGRDLGTTGSAWAGSNGGMSPSEHPWTMQLKHSRLNYTNYVFGKWHGFETTAFEPSEPLHYGFDHAEFLSNFGVGNLWTDWQVTVAADKETSTTAAAGLYTSTYIANATVAAINSGNEPYFIWVSFFNGHVSFHDDIPRTGFIHECTAGSSALCHITQIEDGVDAAIATIMAAVDTSNTLVIVAADNGDVIDSIIPADCGTQGKDAQNECGVNLEFTASFGPIPAANRGTTTAELVSLADVGETILDYARVVNAETLYPDDTGDALYNGQEIIRDGRSIRSILEGDTCINASPEYPCFTTNQRGFLYARGVTDWRVATDGTHKYWVNIVGDTESCHLLPDEIATVAQSNCAAIKTFLAAHDGLTVP